MSIRFALTRFAKKRFPLPDQEMRYHASSSGLELAGFVLPDRSGIAGLRRNRHRV